MKTTTGCTETTGDETFEFDDPGNRTTAAGTIFTYSGSGQLASCTTGCGTVAHDLSGRIQKWNGWAFEYDSVSRMARACQSSTDCTGLSNEVEFAYDADGHRTQIRRYDSGNASPAATWDFRYQGDAIVEEKLTDATHAGVVVRSYVVDDSGSVVTMTIPAGEPGEGTYLPTWNGHGDALGLWRIEAGGTLTLANSFAYATWGTPTTFTHNNVPDLGFRFLYVGEFDVQWDMVHSLGLLYMHARHYAPTLGRFLQPDPDGSEDNLYAYTANNPVTELDPDGTCFIILCIAVGIIIFGGLGAGFGAAKYATGTEVGLERSGSLAEAAGNGFIDGGLLAVPAPGLGRAGRVATKLLGKALTKVPKAARVATSIVRATQRAASTVKKVSWRGGEIRFGSDFRIKPIFTPLRGTNGQANCDH